MSNPHEEVGRFLGRTHRFCDVDADHIEIQTEAEIGLEARERGKLVTLKRDRIGWRADEPTASRVREEYPDAVRMAAHVVIVFPVGEEIEMQVAAILDGGERPAVALAG